MLFGQPEPLQPQDAPRDRLLTMEVDTRYSPYVEMLDRVEFECSQCHRHYWRSIVATERWEEVIVIEGVGTYPVNPSLEYAYEDNPHNC